MEQVTKLKRAWNLVQIFQIVQKISEKYCPSWYLSADQVWWVNELCFKIYRIVAEVTFNVPRNIRESFPWTNKSATKKHLRLQFWINLHSIFYKTPELDSENKWMKYCSFSQEELHLYFSCSSADFKQHIYTKIVENIICMDLLLQQITGNY